VNERFLADENFPRALTRSLRESGFEIAHVAEFMPGADDRAVTSEAAGRDAIILTLDRDFGELAFYRQMRMPGIVLFRLGRQPAGGMSQHVRAFLASPPRLRGYFTVVSVGHVRQRPLLRLVSDET
jgi:predicted nuclease of predicted toxin-antitoxin system